MGSPHVLASADVGVAAQETILVCERGHRGTWFYATVLHTCIVFARLADFGAVQYAPGRAMG
ncbi:MAG: hypothetical protein M0Q92_06355 [Methanoregula sp.]|nr:hypothetical protein [Methanoregula sp.]